MKRLLVVLLVVLAGLVAIKLDKAPLEIYRDHVAKLSVTELSGPDKARYRDALMTINPETGGFNTKEIQRVIRNRKLLRTGESRDFQWQEITSDVGGRARSIMVDPNNPNKLWAGAVTGGLWYTNDFRNNSKWIPVSDDWESMSISSITSDPQNSNVFYVGTGESYTSVNIYRESTSAGVGIYKTTDGGSTWSLLPSTEEFDYVNDIVVRIEDGLSVIYAGVVSGIYQGKVFNSEPSDGLYRSTDGGVSWEQVLPNIPNESVPFAVSDIELTANNQLMVGTMRNLSIDGGGYILTSDDGLNWEVDSFYRDTALGVDALLKPGRVILTSAPSDGDVVYAMGTAGFVNSANQIRDTPDVTYIMRSEQGGNADSWSFIEPPLNFWSNIPWHALAIDVDPNDPNRILIGALDVYALPDATLGGSLNWIRLSSWRSMSYFSPTLISYYGLTDEDSIRNHYVHADIHTIKYLPGSSDEVIFSSDGGMQYTTEMSKAGQQLVGDLLPDYPDFIDINNSFSTTQYYVGDLSPWEGNDLALAGAQDNSTHLATPGERVTLETLIGGGDGAYCFFDEDDPELRITSSQSNSYNIFVGSNGFFQRFTDPNDGRTKGTGTFINPAVYDDRSNLLYANLAVDGGYELLIPDLQGVFLDQVGVIDVNGYLGKTPLLSSITQNISLGTGSQSAFSVLALSPYDPATEATLILGNQFGDVYKVTGLPYAPVSEKIDNDRLPVGYISGIDIGDSNNDLLVTFSNYGIQSVWHTSDGGITWRNLERDLPDIPVRGGLFNPYDDQQIMIATEIGVWGLENINDENEQWKHYSDGFPNVRVDMIKVRKSDSVILAITHGRGMFKGKFTQGEDVLDDPITLSFDEISEVTIYPNPTSGMLNINGKKFDSYRVTDMMGKTILEGTLRQEQVNLSNVKPGLYLVSLRKDDEVEVFKVKVD